MSQSGIKKGDTIELRVERSAFGGRGIAHADGMVVFVDNALPGDLVRARVTKRKAQYAEALSEEIVEPSPARMSPRCAIFGKCGGCKWQDFSYAEQIAAKQQHVEESLRHIGRQTELNVRPIISSPDEWNYRNKMEYSFGTGPDGRIVIGFHQAGDFRRIIPVEQCSIQPEVFDRVLNWMSHELNAEAAKEGQYFRAYNQKDHSGFLRHLVLRYSRATGRFLVAIITAQGKWSSVEGFTSRFLSRFPECAGFIWGLNRGVSDVARVEEVKHEAGENVLEERLGPKTFRISTFSFFQTNTRGAELLYDTVKEFAELTGRESVLDAYCGTGTIGIYLAENAARVVGIEMVRDAIWDARHNAKLNGVENCTFFAGEMRELLPQMPQLVGGSFDRVIIDPPRGGMDKKSLRYLLQIQAPLLIYVSCNPTTLARDAVTLSEAGYEAELVQPVDMFPHTYHVESVIKFRRSLLEPAGLSGQAPVS